MNVRGVNREREKGKRVPRIERDPIALPAEIRVIYFLDGNVELGADGFSRFRGGELAARREQMAGEFRTSCLG